MFMLAEPSLAPAPADVSLTVTILRKLKQSGYEKMDIVRDERTFFQFIETLRVSAKNC